MKLASPPRLREAADEPLQASPAGRTFLEAVTSGVLVLDGGMGTELYDRGVPFDVNYEELVASRPDLVRAVHADFVRAGAEVIETNSFGSSRIRLARHGLEARARELNAAAARLAREAAGERAYVAGAMGPTGLTRAEISGDERARRRVTSAFQEQAEALAEGGASVIILETMGYLDEIELAVQGARLAIGPRAPLFAEVTVDEGLRLLDGTSVALAGARLRDLGCDGIGVNCSCGPEAVIAAAEALVPLGLPVSAAPNAGLPARVGDRFVYASTPDDFADVARRLCALGVRLIGGCCGATPAHIRRMAQATSAERGRV